MRRAVPALAVLLALAAVPRAAAAATWAEAFAGERDTVVFIARDTELWKAPFDLATRETLWRPSGGERVARLRVSPDRRRVAWLVRAHDLDTTRLWLFTPDRAPRVAARYFSFRPAQYRVPVFESVVPGVDDDVVDGARLIDPRATMLRHSSNALAWTPEGGGAVFGFDGGLARVSADSGVVSDVSPVLVRDIRLLDPAPIYLVEVPVKATGGPDPGNYLLYPTPGLWKLFPTSGGLARSSPWTADLSTVWWANGKTLRAIRAHDPATTLEAEEAEDLVWLEALPPRGTVAWAAGRRVRAKPIEGGDAATVLQTAAPITAVLGQGPRSWRAVVAGDSLVMWDWVHDARVAIPLGGIEPTAMFEGPEGQLVLGAKGKAGPAVARIDMVARRLDVVAGPDVKHGRFVASPSGARILLAAPGGEAPRTLRVYDLASGTWSEVVNPGISGWERLAP